MDRGPLALVQDQRRTEADEAYMSVTHSEYTDVLLPTVDHSNFAQDEVQQKTLLNLLYMKLVVEHETSLGGPHNLFLEIDANVSTLGGYTAQRRDPYYSNLGPTPTEPQPVCHLSSLALEAVAGGAPSLTILTLHCFHCAPRSLLSRCLYDSGLVSSRPRTSPWL